MEIYIDKRQKKKQNNDKTKTQTFNKYWWCAIKLKSITGAHFHIMVSPEHLDNLTSKRYLLNFLYLKSL